jgi:hypothetical protein
VVTITITVLFITVYLKINYFLSLYINIFYYLNLINKILLGVLIAAILFIFAYFPLQYKKFIPKNYFKIEQYSDTVNINKNVYVSYKLPDGKNYLLNIGKEETDRTQILKDVLFETYIKKDEIEIKNITIKSAIQKKEGTEKFEELTNDDEYIKLKYLYIYNESQLDTLRTFISNLRKEILE